MSCFPGPDFTMLKPVKREHGKQPGYQRQACFEGFPRARFEGFGHGRILT